MYDIHLLEIYYFYLFVIVHFVWDLFEETNLQLYNYIYLFIKEKRIISNMKWVIHGYKFEYELHMKMNLQNPYFPYTS